MRAASHGHPVGHQRIPVERNGKTPQNLTWGEGCDALAVGSYSCSPQLWTHHLVPPHFNSYT